MGNCFLSSNSEAVEFHHSNKIMSHSPSSQRKSLKKISINISARKKMRISRKWKTESEMEEWNSQLTLIVLAFSRWSLPYLCIHLQMIEIEKSRESWFYLLNLDNLARMLIHKIIINFFFAFHFCSGRRFVFFLEKCCLFSKNMTKKIIERNFKWSEM